MNDNNATIEINLERLFVLELQFKWQMAPTNFPAEGEGEYVGSGDGTVLGEKVKGTVIWDLFEKREAKLCRSNLRGIITVEDGAQIQFDSRGFFIIPHESNPDRWISSASVRFATLDPRYQWLNPRLAVWEGEFNMKTFHHHYQVYFEAGV